MQKKISGKGAGEKYACKELDLSKDGGVYRDSMEKEAKIMEQLLNLGDDALAKNHIIKPIEIIRTFYNKVYIIMELCEGGDLFEYLEPKNGEIPRGLTTDKFIHMTEQILGSIAFLHINGIFHRDIKPENFVVVDSSAEFPQLKLIDFGLATTYIVGQGVQERRICGSEIYQAPEVFYAGRVDFNGKYIKTYGYGEKVDVYSAGAVLYVFATVYDFRRLRDFLTENDRKYAPPLVKAKFDARINEINQFRKKQFQERDELLGDKWRGLIAHLLAQNPGDRPSAKDALIEFNNIALGEQKGKPKRHLRRSSNKFTKGLTRLTTSP